MKLAYVHLPYQDQKRFKENFDGKTCCFAVDHTNYLKEQKDIYKNFIIKFTFHQTFQTLVNSMCAMICPLVNINLL